MYLQRELEALTIMSNNATTNRPREITAAQWDTVAEAVAKGQAVVTNGDGDVIERIEKNGYRKAYLVLQKNTSNSGRRMYYFNEGVVFDHFNVEWLQPAAAASGVSWDSLTADEQAALR